MSRTGYLLLALALSIAQTVGADDYVPRDCPRVVAYAGGALHAPVPADAFPALDHEWRGGLSQPLSLRLDGAVDWILEKTRAPGITAAIGIPGQGVWESTRGVACTSPLQPLAAEPYFHWASAGKAFTAIVIMQLVEEGKLAYSDSLSRWFPKFPNASVITIEHLLTHTNGTFSFQEDLKLRQARGYKAPAELIAVAARHGSIFCPGERWLYSNTGYVLLARIIEEIEGRPYHTVVTTRIIEPLGLRHTIALTPKQRPPGSAIGHVARQPDLESEPSTPFGAGAIVATAADMVGFWRAVLSGSLVSQETILQAYGRLYPMSEPGLFYGRGVMLSEFGDKEGVSHMWLGHSGGTPSAKAVIAYDVTERVLIAVAFNGDVSAEAAANKLLAELKAYRAAARDQH